MWVGEGAHPEKHRCRRDEWGAWHEGPERGQASSLPSALPGLEREWRVRGLVPRGEPGMHWGFVGPKSAGRTCALPAAHPTGLPPRVAYATF